MQLTPDAFPELKPKGDPGNLSKRSHSQAKLNDAVSSQPSVNDEIRSRSKQDHLSIHSKQQKSRRSSNSIRKRDPSKRLSEKTTINNKQSRSK